MQNEPLTNTATIITQEWLEHITEIIEQASQVHVIFNFEDTLFEYTIKEPEVSFDTVAHTLCVVGTKDIEQSFQLGYLHMQGRTETTSIYGHVMIHLQGVNCNCNLCVEP